MEVDHAKQEDDIPIDNIMKRIIESVTKPLEKIVAKDMVDVDKETESDEAPTIKVMKSKARSMVERVKEKKKKLSSIKNIEIVKKKTLQRTPVSKKRKVEEKPIENNSLKRKLVQSSDSETDAEANVQDIVSTIRRNTVENGFL